MDKTAKLEAFSKLHSLIIYYSEYRDRPVQEDFDFFNEVKECCNELEINYEDFLERFKF